MRTSSVCWGVVITFMVVSGPISAQAPPTGSSTYPAEMSIVLPEVDVRSGPTIKYFATARLRMGDRVQVLRECKDQPGWLAIKPPAGSFSWIKGNAVKQVGTNTGYVESANNAAVAVMPGSSVDPRKPNHESVTVPSGSVVVILDKPFHFEGEVWLPIQPPPTEVRYIPAEAVRSPAPAVVVSNGNFPTAVGSAGMNGLLYQADQARRSGNVDQARQLFRQVADKSTDPQQRIFALNSLASLTTPATPGVPANPNWHPVDQQSSVSYSPGQTTSHYTKGSPITGAANLQPPHWSGWGYLRRTRLEKEGQPVYVLETRQGQPLVYAIQQPGTRPDLHNCVGRMICLYGPIAYRGDEYPRVEYMVVTHKATMP